MSQITICFVTRKSSMVASKIVATKYAFIVKLILLQSSSSYNNLRATCRQNSYCYCYFII